MSYSIRRAKENDFDAIHTLNKEFSHFIKTPEKYKITLEQMKAEQQYFHSLVVEDETGKIIGFATTFIAWYSWIGKSLYLDDLYIIERSARVRNDDYRRLALWDTGRFGGNFA